MYCGSNKTAIASQRQVSAALMELLNEKKFSEITISELCKKAGISRQTFYILFKAKENVVIFTLQDQYAYSLGDSIEGKLTMRKFCECYAQYIIANQDYLKTLVDNGIEHLMYESLYCAMTCEKCQTAIHVDNRTYAAHYLSGAIVSIMKAYVEEGCTTSREDLVEIIFTMFSGNLFTE